MFLPKKKGYVFLDFFSRQKSPRCSPGGGVLSASLCLGLGLLDEAQLWCAAFSRPMLALGSIEQNILRNSVARLPKSCLITKILPGCQNLS
jgi:hypothetical protein